MRLAGEPLARDLKALTGQQPATSNDLANCRQLCIVVGRRDSTLVKAGAGSLARPSPCIVMRRWATSTARRLDAEALRRSLEQVVCGFIGEEQSL